MCNVSVPGALVRMRTRISTKTARSHTWTAWRVCSYLDLLQDEKKAYKRKLGLYVDED